MIGLKKSKTADPDAPVAAAASAAVVARGPWELAWRRLRRDRVALISGGILLLIILMAIFAPVINSIFGQDPNYQDQVNGLDVNGLPLGPSGAHWLGTDQLGRDVLARLIAGSQVSIGIGIASTALAVIIGVVLGLLAGYLGGIVDTIIARLLDVILSIPIVLAAVALVAVVEASSPNGASSQTRLLVLVLILAFFSWATMARIVRGQVLSLREREFVEAARSLGSSTTRIMFVELLPNLVMPIIIYFSLLVPVNIVTEATLAFLGLGIPVPTADWGGMISDANTSGLYQHAWWMVVFPGGILVITTLVFNLLGDGIRDALDPRIERLLRK